MPQNIQMTIDERRKYLCPMSGRYAQADRIGRSQLLDEMQTVTGMHRKSLIRLPHSHDLACHPRTKQHQKSYGAQADDAIRLIWESLDYIGAERRIPALPPTAQYLAQHGELVLSERLLEQLSAISKESVQRRLSRFNQDTSRLPRRSPEQANRVACSIPMHKIAWDQRQPGQFEVDLVHHGGAEPSGNDPYTLQLMMAQPAGANGWSCSTARLSSCRCDLHLVLSDSSLALCYFATTH